MAQTRAFHMPLHHLHLVPEHQELDVLLILQATSGSEQTGDEEVHEREQHGAPSGRRERMLPVALGAGLGFLNPFRLRNWIQAGWNDDNTPSQLSR
jgi:hypothetical protein